MRLDRKSLQLGLVLIAVAAHAIAAAETKTLRVSAYLPAHSRSVARVMIPWLDRIEQAADGRLAFERYWGGSLGRGPQRQVLLVEAGVTDIAFLWPGMTPGRFPDLQIFETPLLVRTAEEGSLLAWRLYEERLLRGFDGVEVLGFYSVAPARLFTVETYRPASEMPRFKIRTVGPVQANFVRRLGALPETLEASAVSDGLRRGTIDGLIQGWTGMQTFRQYREARYVVDVPAGVSVFALVMHRPAWHRLDDTTQAIFRRLGGESLALAGGRAFDEETATISRELVATGHVEPLTVTDEDRRRFSAWGEAVLEDWVGDDPHRHAVQRRAAELLNEMRTGPGTSR